MVEIRAKDAEKALIAFGHTLPEITEEYPWEHTVLKVRKKVFVFFGGDQRPDGELSVTVKLPVSFEMACTLPFVKPARHGLGKSGWVQAIQVDGDDIDLPLYRDWIVQSYCAVAPKKLAKLVEV